MESQSFPAVLPLDTPPPSPPSKRPKLESPTTPTQKALQYPHHQNEAPQDKQAQNSHENTHQNNGDLPEDFLEPLDTHMNAGNNTFSSPLPGPLPVPPLPPCSSSLYSHSSNVQSGSLPSLATHVQQPSPAVSAPLIPPQQIVNSTPPQTSTSAHLPNSTLTPPPTLLPVQVRHLRGALPPLPSSFPSPQCMNMTPTSSPHLQEASTKSSSHHRGCRQFWKAGDYELDRSTATTKFTPGGLDHVRVHPKFLHSNATSHKWALGAVAELLDNALDEVSNGATYVDIDMVCNPQDSGPMLLFEDDGGGMTPDCLRQCMSLGYSAKSKRANTIGQYGNGFKTSTMRLGSDVLVFTRRPGNSGGSPTQSIGMLSYSFLRDTNQEDIVVPMVDYEIESFGLRKQIRSTVEDWNCNMTTITKWSPYHSEAELLNQFQNMKHQGTKIIVYNLWEDEEGQLELDFEEDIHDIQVRGANRDEKKIAMAAQYPNSRHYLTYRHSLRSYASILYLRLPKEFHIILRGKEVEHHPLVNDMMFAHERKYKPQSGGNAALKETNMVADVTIGFVKDAKEHIDVQGFNVYHKNRLIKPFWRIWNAASSQGRGIIAVLEANFVEPAHDKQGFERTVVLSRLEYRLLQMQKAYWKDYSHKVGYGKKDSPRVHYPARGLIRLEAPHLSRVVTRGSSSMQDSFDASKSPNPETLSVFHTNQEDCVLSGVPISRKEGTSTENKGCIETESCSKQTLAQRDEDLPSPLNRNDMDTERFKLEVDQIDHWKWKVSELRKTVDEVMKERDRLKTQLEDESGRQAIEVEDLRFKLKAAYLRIEQLEGERDGFCVS